MMKYVWGILILNVPANNKSAGTLVLLILIQMLCTWIFQLSSFTFHLEQCTRILHSSFFTLHLKTCLPF